MTLRPRTETELREILRETLEQILQSARNRIEQALDSMSARPYRYEPELGEAFVEAYTNQAEARITLLLEMEEGL